MNNPVGSGPIETGWVDLRANFRHLYADILWFGILSGSTLAFLNIYVTRLGGTSFQISLLTALPAMINLFFSLPAVRWLGERPLARITFGSAVVTRLGYLALVPLACFLGNSGQIEGVVAITGLMAVPGTLLAIAFNAMFADVVPPEQRGEVVGKRNALMAITMTISNLVCGQLLDRITFPLNYQIVFAFGALGAVLSTYHLSCLRLPARTTSLNFSAEPARRGRGGLFRLFIRQEDGKPLLRCDLLRGRFGRFFAAYLLFYTFQYIPLPLFPLAVVNQLRLTDGQISLGNTMFYILMMVVSFQLSRLSRRFGHHAMLAFSAVGYSLYPLLIGLAKGPGLYWVASPSGGVLWALISAASINRLMEVVPEDDRPSYMAIHNITLNTGILIGSFIAPVLSATIGLQPALLVSSGLRLLAGILFIFWG